MARELTPRGKALRWLSTHRGLTEQPANSNWDTRTDGIAAAIKRCGFNYGVPWCGVWFYNAMRAAGVKGISTRQASVALIEEDAKAHRGPFRGWITPATKDWHKKALRGDGVVLFGYGVHVETLRSTAWGYRKLGYIATDGGNTSSGNSGSQDNGGGSFRRLRRISDVRGLALVDYPDN
jgi:hypothetical protein